MRSITSTVLSVLLASTIIAQSPAPSFAIDYPQFFPGGFMARMTTAGPANAVFTVYACLQNPFNTPFEQLGIFELFSGQLDNTGHSQTWVPIFGPSEITEIWFAAFEVELVSLDLHVTPPVAAAGKVDAPPPVVVGPAPCVSDCAMSYDPATCTVILVGKFCPGDIIAMKVNGVTVMTGVGSSSGVVVLANGALCLHAGDLLTGTVNGVGTLGPIHG